MAQSQQKWLAWGDFMAGINKFAASITIKILQTMKLKVAFLVITLSLTQNLMAQDDIELIVNGFSDEIKQILTANEFRLKDGLSGSKVSLHEKIKVIITLKDGEGFFNVFINYNPELTNHKDIGKPRGNYFFLALPSRIFSAIAYYNMYVRFKLQRDDLQSFDTNLILTKPNKDYLIVMANGGKFYKNVFFSYNGKKYETETEDYNSLRNYIFKIGTTDDMSGKQNANYYLAKFLDLK
ncbi:MAG: hypothetical protein ACKVOQ_14225 [Cyclobacteriaceae bacterium]